MGRDSCRQAAEGVRKNSFARQFTITQRVEHGRMRTQKATPAHADGCKYGDGIAINPALRKEIGHQTQSGAHGSQCCDGESNLMRIRKTKQSAEQPVKFVGQSRQ